MVKNYDCRNAIEPLKNNYTYLEEQELAKESFESADILFRNGKYRGAYVQLMIGLQNLGQSVLIYRFKARTKSKMCQFKYLNEQNLLDNYDIEFLTELIEKRNDVYYNNPVLNSSIDKEEYEKLLEKIMKLIKKLEGLL